MDKGAQGILEAVLMCVDLGLHRTFQRRIEASQVCSKYEKSFWVIPCASIDNERGKEFLSGSAISGEKNAGTAKIPSVIFSLQIEIGQSTVEQPECGSV